MFSIHQNIKQALGRLNTTLVCLFGIVLLSLNISCKKELNAPELQALEAGELTASKEEVVINAAAPGDEAVKLSWTAEGNTLVRYFLVFSANGGNDTTEAPSGASTRSFTNAQLNDIAVKKLMLPIGVTADVLVHGYAAVVINDKKDSTNTITLKITPAATGPAYSKLWIVGSATPNGWNIDNPNELWADPENAFQFKYNEVLNSGEFKFPVTTGNWGTDYFMPVDNHQSLSSTAVKFTPGGSPDNKWEINNPGAYKILLNISESPFIKITAFTPYNEIFIVGDATPAGWNIDNPVTMTKDPVNPYLFSWVGQLSQGEFKFPLQKGNWGGDFFFAPMVNASITTKDLVFVKAGSSHEDTKFRVNAGEEGTYKITVDQLKEKISVEKK